MKTKHGILLSACLAVLTLGGVALVGWLALRQFGITRPLEILKPAPQPISHSTVVAANYVGTYKILIPNTRVPGTLSGRWNSRGASAKVSGAVDDSLIEFRIKGPNGEVLQRKEKPTEGSFSLPIRAAGYYTFEFDNAGIIRLSSRLVELIGEYQSD